METLVNVGEKIAISAQLSDGDLSFPVAVKAVVRDSEGVVLDELFLTHVAQGLFLNRTFKMPEQDFLIVQLFAFISGSISYKYSVGLQIFRNAAGIGIGEVPAQPLPPVEPPDLPEIPDFFKPPLSLFDVYYLDEFVNDLTGIEVRWAPYSTVTIEKYKVYKSPDQTPYHVSTENLILLGEFDSCTFSYFDEGGTAEDYYAVSTVSADGLESGITAMKKATDFVPALCRIEGVAIDLQGARQVDVKVVARLVTPPQNIPIQSFISLKEVSTLTTEDGRFSLMVAQGAKIIIEIEGLQICDPIEVPAVPFVALEDLPIYEEYKFKDR